MGLYDQAFASAARANAIKADQLGCRYDADKYAAEADKLKKILHRRPFQKAGHR